LHTADSEWCAIPDDSYDAGMRYLLIAFPLVACIHLPDFTKRQQEHIQRLCVDRNYSYETGYNAGRNGRGLDTSWVDTSCAPERRETIRASYQAGYQQGVVNAPIVVKVRGHHTHTDVTPRPSCQFASDCISGWCDGTTRSCRD
jgi:hypothetical protein